MPAVTLSQLESHFWKAAWLLKGPVDAADFLPVRHGDICRALPGQLCYGTQIPVCLRFLAKNKAADAKRGFRDRIGLENQLALAA